jgi:hypothetical protein
MGRGSAAELIRYALKHGRTTHLAWKQPRINHPRKRCASPGAAHVLAPLKIAPEGSV